MAKVQDKQSKVIACFFCKKVGHLKKDCIKHQKCLIKKGISHIYVCSEINLALVPLHTWSIDNSHKRFNTETFKPKRDPAQLIDMYT